MNDLDKEIAAAEELLHGLKKKKEIVEKSQECKHRNMQFAKLQNVLDSDLVDILAPDHTTYRQNCDDFNLCSGIADMLRTGEEYPTCDRCTLLEVLEGKYSLSDLPVGISCTISFFND